MAGLDYYFTTISPFVYLAGQRLEEIAARHGLGVTYKPVDPMALFARTGGTPPAERHPNRQALRLQELRRQSRKRGLELNERPAFFPANPAPSAYAIIAAQEAGGGDLGALVHALARACWAEEKDVSEDEVIKAALSEAGFDPALADSGLLLGAETYPRNLEEAVGAGVFGVPFYITQGGERFWGQDRLEDLDAHLSGEL
ncbi:2-hydroxychromene-2-carboxylate isomerase [Roseicyclus sp. F158]|uniref:2-hydroxychromene-2-carboxylate isomerase n=1 Tax=Tropicimonas omnivorans TaxID=3075590 RepID=A0ABU3DFT8_9RHOB|nr:2-hydroxychromene-2-carboxylate isomerase [Roseicyclus sp. F158]MDT0682580.1 2-hydroxychromene-2-carboxylate isomerase [Roseicyclus sp. F158]